MDARMEQMRGLVRKMVEDGEVSQEAADAYLGLFNRVGTIAETLTKLSNKKDEVHEKVYSSLEGAEKKLDKLSPLDLAVGVGIAALATGVILGRAFKK